MENKIQHTPTPWTTGLYDPSDDFKAIKTHIAICKPDGALLATCGPVDKESKEDAAFIVRAANAHEELIDQLKASVELLKTIIIDHRESSIVIDHVRHCEVVIAKADVRP